MDATDLAGRWRTLAEDFRRYGQESAAAMAEAFAGELEEWWREWWLEQLTLEEAADEAGVSYSAMQKRLAEGRVTNVGRRGSPLVRRADLFPGLSGPRLTAEDGGPDLAAEILKGRTGS